MDLQTAQAKRRRTYSSAEQQVGAVEEEVALVKRVLDIFK